MLRDGLELLEYPFLTLQTFPDGFIQRIGGLVSCRSVKLLEGMLLLIEFFEIQLVSFLLIFQEN